jgi:hypothetical protein
MHVKYDYNQDKEYLSLLPLKVSLFSLVIPSISPPAPPISPSPLLTPSARIHQTIFLVVWVLNPGLCASEEATL